MKRSEGERVRLQYSIARLRGNISGLEKGLSTPGPIGLEATSALMTSACEVILQVAKLDAYTLAEHDTEEDAKGCCCQCHRSKNPDGSKVMWRCQTCKRPICSDCALKDVLQRTYLDTTLCSEECKSAHNVQSRMLGHPVEDD